jgi:acetoin utilization deacetylase AcuC-like enzyme
MPLALISSPRFADHVTPPGHPERVERADVLERTADVWRDAGGQVLDPRPATREEVARVHRNAYIDAIEATRGRSVMLDADTFTSPDTAAVAELAAGAALTGLEWVLAGTGPGASAPGAGRRALALVRPPGHHAEAGKAMGFCIYNNVALAAAAALARGLSRVAVVDYDVHHGNGTQHSFYGDPRVLVVSAHQYPFYPGTGAATERGEGDGDGFTVNVPLESGCTDGDYDLVFARVVEPVLDAFGPELLLVSAGFDAHAQDPLAHMRMSAAGFAALTRRLRDAADRLCGGRLVAITEGGYELTALGQSLAAAVRVLAGQDDGAAPALDAATGRGEAAVHAVRAAQAGRWRGL